GNPSGRRHGRAGNPARDHAQGPLRRHPQLLLRQFQGPRTARLRTAVPARGHPRRARRLGPHGRGRRPPRGDAAAPRNTRPRLMSGPRQRHDTRRPFGFVEWFRPGEYERVEAMLPGIVASGASHLRTHLSWAEYLAPGGEEWFDWLLPKLGGALDLLPCVHYTPPSLSRTGRTSGAPRDLKSYAD